MSLFNFYKAFVLEFVDNNTTYTASNLLISPIDHANLQDGNEFNDQHILNEFERFLNMNQIGYYCYFESKCIARGWVFTISKRAYVGTNFLFSLSENEVFIAWCETDPNYRRKGALNALLDQIKKENKEKRLLTYIDPQNSASLSAFQKAGFSICKKYYCLALWKLKLSIRYFNEGKFNFKIRFGDYIK